MGAVAAGACFKHAAHAHLTAATKAGNLQQRRMAAQGCASTPGPLTYWLMQLFTM